MLHQIVSGPHRYARIIPIGQPSVAGQAVAKE
ncbi:predicted protein [Streptomyces filamentosus NRRL 15998]|uniref:Predicted protein n=1 Tax=Streptomyces filamentosus NRRL 15998 TaxID=457431 RepID=D6AB30_STRFL|nr:predicted protein [Streptomyces filamentosus NRRL 15998]